MNTFILNSCILILSSLFIKILSSFFEIYIANMIGATAVGAFGIIMSIYFLGVTLATSGIHLATTKVLSEEIEKKNLGNIKKVIKRSLTYSFIMGCVAYLLIVLFTPYICNVCLKGKINYVVIYILGLCFPFVALSSALNGYFLSLRKILQSSICQIICQIIKIVIIYILFNIVLSKSLNYTILFLVLGATISEILYFILLYILYIKSSKKYNNHGCNCSSNITKNLLKISIPIALTSYIRSFLSTLKQILIPIRLRLSGMSYDIALANYGIITGMALPVIMFSSVIVYSYSSLLVPEFSRYTINNKNHKMENNICKLFKITLCFSIGVTGILMYFGDILGNVLFTSKNVGYYIKIMAPLIPIMYLDNVVDNILKGLGKQVSVMICNILDLIISVLFIYFLLPKFGTIGYVIVMYISEILNYSISVITLFKLTNLKFKYFEWVIFPIISIILSITINNIFNISLNVSIGNLVFQIISTITLYILMFFLKNRISKCII